MVWSAAIAGLLSGCVDHSEQSLCISYAEYVVVADAVAATDTTGATASDASEAVEVLLGEVAQLRAVSESRYRAPIDELEELLDDLENTLDALVDDADYATWEPLVDETIADVGIADDRLRRVMNPACAARFAESDE
ncbi:MAG: hypothetical protein AB8G26_12470 [Ilumatobacter sp.]